MNTIFIIFNYIKIIIIIIVDYSSEPLEALHEFKFNYLFYLNIEKGDKLVVLLWNTQNNWVFGYKVNDPQKRGFFHISVVKNIQLDMEKLPIYYDANRWYRVFSTDSKQIGAFKYLEEAVNFAIKNSKEYEDFLITDSNGNKIYYKDGFFD